MKEMEVGEFVRELHLLATQESRFAFFIGAGCSYSSGIPTARELVEQWLPKLKKKKTNDMQEVETWAKEYFKHEYDQKSLSKLYANTINELFPHPKSRQQEIERLTEGKEPFLGYALLANLMGDSKFSERFNMILTTNFDDLVADALYLYTSKRPRVISHESLVSFASSSSKKPHVIKLHGDAQFDPKNTSRETDKLEPEVENVLKEILAERGIIFLGYGGNDSSIIKLLSKLNERSLQWGIYWVSPNLPSSELSKWLDQRNATWVKHRDFDEFMLLLSNEFGIKTLDRSNFELRFKNMMDSNHAAIKKIQGKILEKPESEVKIHLNEALKKIIDDSEDWFQLAMNANEQAKTDFSSAEKLYQEGFIKFGNNGVFLGLFGELYFDYAKYENSAKYLEKALKMEPNNEVFLNLLGLSYNYIGKLENALDCFKKLLELKPDDASYLSNYGLVLCNMKKYDESLPYVEKSLLKEPNEPIPLAIKGMNLRYLGRYDEALESFLKSLRIGTERALTLLHIGSLYRYLGDQKEAIKYFNKILEIKGKQNFIGYVKGKALNYLRKPEEAIKYFDEELENTPKDIFSLIGKAISFTYLKQYPNALQCLNDAVTIRPNESSIFYSFAIYYDAQNNYLETKNYLKKAMEVDKGFKSMITGEDFVKVKSREEIDELLK